MHDSTPNTALFGPGVKNIVKIRRPTIIFDPANHIIVRLSFIVALLTLWDE